MSIHSIVTHIKYQLLLRKKSGGIDQARMNELNEDKYCKIRDDLEREEREEIERLYFPAKPFKTIIETKLSSAQDNKPQTPKSFRNNR